MFKFLLKVVLLALGVYLLTQEVPKLMQGARDSTTVVYTVLRRPPCFLYGRLCAKEG
jgi:hypothetical protein